MARKKKMSICDAQAELRARGVDMTQSYHALGRDDVDTIVEVAKLTGYRKSKNAPGSKARMFFEYAKRKRCRK